MVLLRTAARLADGAAEAPEVLFIQRPSTMAFGPGLHAFPGGRVDPEDAAGPPGPDGDLGGNVSPGDAAALRRAAVREVHEEIGIRLADDALLAPVAHFTTPVFMPRRFSTWFFAADLPEGAEPVFEVREVAGHDWHTPMAALDRLAAGEIEMWVPTTSVLQRLIEIGARRAADVRDRITFGPAPTPVVLEESETAVRLAFGAAGGIPGRRCETTLLGRRGVVVVDPGDASEEALRLIEETVARRGGTIRAILLTSPNPDRAAGAELLAIPHEVPVLVAPGAGGQLPYAVVELADGQRLPGDAEAAVLLDAIGTGRLRVSGAGRLRGSG
ncbi:MAG TPA: NUDIX domain-containing protein [Candidatus Limnocylindrales bacterium]